MMMGQQQTALVIDSVQIGCTIEYLRLILLYSARKWLPTVGLVANIMKIFRPKSQMPTRLDFLARMMKEHILSFHHPSCFMMLTHNGHQYF